MATPSSTNTPLPDPTQNPTYTITPTENPEPIFPEYGMMTSEHLTASLSKKWMDTAGISSVSLDPKILEQIYQVMLVHWAANFATFSDDTSVKAYDQFYACDQTDDDSRFNFLIFLPKAHLQNALEAYQANFASKEPFDYTFYFDQGVSGKIETIDIKVLANKQEYQYILNQLSNQGIKYAHVFSTLPNSSDDTALFYFGSKNDLHVYTWDGNPYKMKYLDSSIDRSYALLADLFYYPLVNGGVSILRTNKRRFPTQCGGYALHEALGCVDFYCNKTGQSPSNFAITLLDATKVSSSIDRSAIIIQTPTPQILKAAYGPLEIGDYSILLSNIQVMDIGSNPLFLNSNLAISIVFTEANHDLQKSRQFAQIGVWFTDESGNNNGNYILDSLDTQSGPGYFRWIVYVSQRPDTYFMHFNFAEGEVIVDLSPYLQ